MTFKLVKYEFRSMIRLMGVLWAGLPAMAIIMAVFQKIFPYDGLGEYPAVLNILNNLFTFTYIAMFIALIAVTVIIIIMRFYKGLMRDEGYLMHTLPVKTRQLITAKGVTAVAVSIISMAVAVVSILLLSAFDGVLINRIGYFLSELAGLMTKHPVYVLMCLEVIILALAWIMADIYKVYASLSIGQMAPKYKIALSAAVYIGISIASILLLTAFAKGISMLAGSLPQSVLQPVQDWFAGLSMADGLEGVVMVSLFLFIIYDALQIAVYHIISEQSLRRRLNLE